MPRVKGIYEDGIIKPKEKIKLANLTEVEIIYEETEKKKIGEKPKIVTVKAREFRPMKGIVSLGGDAVKDTERYDESSNNN